MRRTTKHCRLTVETLSGVRISGLFHVEATISSSIRPSDALRDMKSTFLVLAEAVRMDGNGQQQPLGTTLVRIESIAYVELTDRGWSSPV